MEWKLFFSTFVLIFFAELGDKTQLAAMASAAGNKSTWSVFAGASAALVVSTFVAVLLGSTLQKTVPEHWIKTFAGLLFLFFGVLLLVNAFRSRPAEALAPAGEAEVLRVGPIGRAVMEAALRFEEAAAEDYAGLAKSVESPALRELFLGLAQSESAHFTHIRDLIEQHTLTETEASEATEATAPERFLAERASLLPEEKRILAEAAEHERAQARFYEALAADAAFPALKRAFLTLAEEEQEHARRISEHMA